MVPGLADLQREEHGIQNRRMRCSFDDTQKLLAKVLDSKSKSDRPWVLYLYGQIHMARSAALAGSACSSSFPSSIRRLRAFAISRR